MLYLDSASEEDARAAVGLGYVAGVTTNPSLLARAGGPPLKRLELLLECFPAGRVFYQPGRPSTSAQEAREALRLGGDRVVIKLPALPEGASLAVELASEGVTCALTAVYTPGQALVAAAVGASWVIPYVDRVDRQGGDGLALVDELSRALRSAGAATSVLAASIKSAEQAVLAFRHGAGAVTAPLGVLEGLGEDSRTREAVAEFMRSAE